MIGTLQQEEIDALEDGALIEVTWGGGNGPHRYRVRRIYDTPHAYLIGEDVMVAPLTRIHLHYVRRTQ